MATQMLDSKTCSHCVHVYGQCVCVCHILYATDSKDLKLSHDTHVISTVRYSKDIHVRDWLCS